MTTIRPGLSRGVGVTVAMLALVATLLAASGPVEAVQQAATSERQAQSMSGATYQHRLLHWINRARDQRSTRSVRLGPCVDDFADSWARRLAVRKQFKHQDLGPIMRRCSLSAAGEIIAMGQVSPRQMVRMWLNSDGHRAILLSKRYRIAGVGAHLGDNRAWYGVVDFGRR